MSEKFSFTICNENGQETFFEATMLNENGSFSIFDQNGQENKYETLFIYTNDENGRNYIVYTNYSVDEMGRIMVFASILNSDSGVPRLSPIESEKEWFVIEKIIEKLEIEITGKSTFSVHD